MEGSEYSEQEDDLVSHHSSYNEYSADGGQGNYDISGRVKLSIWWKQGSLYVKILRAKHLATIDGHHPSPFIKTSLMPDYSNLTKRKTRVKYKTTSPVYNKVICINERDLPTKGELNFSLKYQPDEGGCLFVYVFRLRNLIPNSKYTNYFIRTLLFPEQRIQKTECIIGVTDPVWRRQLKFNHITFDELQTAKVLEISLWNFDGKKCHEFIGCVRLGPKQDKANKIPWMDSNDLECSLWSAMLSHPGQWIHTNMELRPSIASCVDNSKEISLTEEEFSNKECNPGVKGKSPVHLGEALLGDYDISGRVLVKLEHVKEILVVNILRADNLASVGHDNVSNPYFKVYLFHNNGDLNKWSSNVKRNTVNPLFNETIKFPVKESQLPSIVLKLCLLHYEDYNLDSVLGWININLSIFHHWGNLHWYNLNQENTNTQSTVECIPANIELSLKYTETGVYKGQIDGDLDIYISKINGISYDENEGDSYCVITVNILPGMGSVHSPEILLKDCNPQIYHTFKFQSITFDYMYYELCMEVRVLKLTKTGSTVIGGLRLGHAQLVGHIQRYMDCNVLESTHWELMLACADEWVNCIHTLRSNMDHNDLSKPERRNCYYLNEAEDERKLVILAKFEPMTKKFQLKGNLFVKFKAKNLKCKTSDGFYATCKIYPHLEVDKWKHIPTETIKDTANPIWEKVFIFENMFEDDLFTKRVLNVKVVEVDNNNDELPFIYIGRVCLGLEPENSTTEEILHWQAIFRNPGEWVEDIHPLRH